MPRKGLESQKHLVLQFQKELRWSPTPYQQLAQRLNALPEGFPATESGVELRLLAKLFSPEEAALAAR
jgi:hypothetical protein